MVYLKWAFWITFWVLVAVVFHYTLPQNDIVRVTDCQSQSKMGPCRGVKMGHFG